MMGKHAARQTAAVLLAPLDEGTGFGMLGLFLLFIYCCFLLFTFQVAQGDYVQLRGKRDENFDGMREEDERMCEPDR